MDYKQKYVKLIKYNSIIVFSPDIDHCYFKEMGVISAGFCIVGKDRVDCFGYSLSLDLHSDTEEDTLLATSQFFGIEAALKLI